LPLIAAIGTAGLPPPASCEPAPERLSEGTPPPGAARRQNRAKLLSSITGSSRSLAPGPTRPPNVVINLTEGTRNAQK